jgi:hypothetical protein
MVPLQEFPRHQPIEFLEEVTEWTVQRYLFHWSLTQTSEGLLAIADRHPWLRHQMSGAWRVISSWRGLMPVRLHPPIPWTVFRAMVTVALAWGWTRVAILLLCGFFGLLRPREFWELAPENIVLPTGHDLGQVVFLLIRMPKTAARAARHQYVKIEHAGTVSFLAKVVPNLPEGYRIYGGSQASLKARMSSILTRLSMPDVILPSSLRPGGATYYFHVWNEDVQRIQWRGRWASARMLEHYIQELQTIHVLRNLPRQTRARVDHLSELMDECLADLS